MLIVAIIFIVDPSEYMYLIIIILLTTGLAIKGISDIVFYFTMAKHMVGGKTILFQGVIVLDFALVTATFTDLPRVYILLYLLGVHAFSGVIEVLRAMEARKAVDGPWKLKLSHGIVNFLLALACLIFIGHPDTAVIIYGIGLLYSAVNHIISAFRMTAFVLIE